MQDNKEVKYNSFPLGQLPVELQRSELHILRAMGYSWEDDREVIDIFEKKIAEFWGANYFVATDCCTHAIELSLRYLLLKGWIGRWQIITVPRHTYVSAVQVLKKLSLQYNLTDTQWKGMYRYGDAELYDCAVRWKKNGYLGGEALQCLSFQAKKVIAIGRGGGILTDSKEAYDTLKLMSYDGRDLKTLYTSPDHVKITGYHYYMDPESAARGIILFEKRKHMEGDYGGSDNYPDLMPWSHAL